MQYSLAKKTPGSGKSHSPGEAFKVVEDWAGTSSFFKWLDTQRSSDRVRPFELVVAVAAVMCLRWIETDEEEALAILAFEEGEFSEEIEPPRILERWVSQQFDLAEELERVLEKASAGEACCYAQYLAPGLRHFSFLPPEVQREIVLRIQTLDPASQIGRRQGKEMIDSLLDWLAKEQKGYAGEFRTPQSLIDLVISLADPKPGERVYDPCFGRAGFLAAAAHHQFAKTKATDASGWSQVRRNGIYGREINGDIFILGLAHLVYEGVDLPRLEIGNSLENEGFNGQSDSGYDCIIANPPLGLRVDEPQGHHFPVPMRDADGLFIQHIVQSLRPGGRAVVVVPPGVLFASGRMAKLRKYLVEHQLIEQIIALPKAILKPYTTIAVNLLVLRNGKGEGPIRFINLSRVDLGQHGGKNLDELSELPGAYCYTANAQEISQRNHDLVVREPGENDLRQSIMDLAQEFPEVEIANLGRVAEVKRGVHYRSHQLVDQLELADEEPISVIRVSDVQRGQLQSPKLFLKGGEAEKIRQPFFLQPSDTLLTISGTIGKLAFAGQMGSQSVVTHGLAIIRPSQENLAKRFLFALLRSEAYQKHLSSFSKGTSISHLSMRDLRNIPIPVPPVPIQSQVVEYVEQEKGDGFAHLQRLLRKKENDPVSSWLRDSQEVAEIIRLVDDVSDPIVLLPIQTVARSFRTLRNRIAHNQVSSSDTAPELLEWLTKISTAIQRLASIASISNAFERYNLLQVAELTLSNSLDDLADHPSPDTQQAALFTKSLVTLLGWERDEIATAQAVFSHCSDQVGPDEETIISVSIRNDGPLPLTELTITDPVTGSEKVIPYFTAGQTESIEIGFEPKAGVHEFEGKFYFDLQVEALLPDGQPFKTEIETGVAILENWEKEVDETAGTQDSGGGLWNAQVEKLERENNWTPGMDDFENEETQLLDDEARWHHENEISKLLSNIPGYERIADARAEVEAIAQEQPRNPKVLQAIKGMEEFFSLVEEAAEAKRRAEESTLEAYDALFSNPPDLPDPNLKAINEKDRQQADALLGNLTFKCAELAEILEECRASIKGTLPQKKAFPSDRVESAEKILASDLGTSPYTTGSPVNKADMLFGRQNTLSEIRTQLPIDSQANVILLEGNRRAGKTSILKQLQTPDFLPDWVVCYCSLQSGEGAKDGNGLATSEVFRIMARCIGEQLIKEGFKIWFPGHPGPDPERGLRPQFRAATQKVFSGDYPFETFEDFLLECLEAVKPRRLLLCLDEFDKLQEGIDSGVTSSTVPENIRFLLHEHPNFVAILTGSRRLKRLREEYWHALFGLGHRIGVSALELEDAKALVTKPVDRCLAYSPDAVDLITHVTARQPYLIQLLCNRIFQQAKDDKQTSISPQHVKRAIDRMVEDNEHFRTLWGYAESWRRRLVLSLARKQEAADAPLTLGILREQLPELGVILPDGDPLADDLDFLRELEMLRLASDGSHQSYALEVPLFGMWIDKTQDFEEVVEKAKMESEQEAGL